jgi:hypothetical protein
VCVEGRGNIGYGMELVGWRQQCEGWKYNLNYKVAAALPGGEKRRHHLRTHGPAATSPTHQDYSEETKVEGKGNRNCSNLHTRQL